MSLGRPDGALQESQACLLQDASLGLGLPRCAQAHPAALAEAEIWLETMGDGPEPSMRPKQRPSARKLSLRPCRSTLKATQQQPCPRRRNG